MKKLRNRVTLFWCMAFLITVLGNSLSHVTAYAAGEEFSITENGETGYEDGGDTNKLYDSKQAVTTDNEVSDSDIEPTDAPKNSAANDDNAKVSAEDADETSADARKGNVNAAVDNNAKDNTKNVSEDDGEPSQGIDVCFYIKGGIEGSEIPYEPESHPSSDYSDPIRVDGAGKDEGFFYSPDTSDQYLDDGFTVDNEVIQGLNKVPSSDEIKQVVPDFNPDIHYVQWYVYKKAATPEPDSDVVYHVDGVIGKKEASSGATSDSQEDNEEDTPKIRILIQSCCDKDVIVYDGQPHKVGGFTIDVIDDNQDKTLVQYIYDLFGVFKEKKVYASEGQGTSFEYGGVTYWVSVDAAYLEVTEPGEYTIPFYFNGSVIDANDIVIKDGNGNAVNGVFDIVPSRSNVTVKREITIEAGTTVKNDDGKPLTNNKYDIIAGCLMQGHSISSVTFVGCQYGPGETKNEITNCVIVDEKGNDVTKMYDITYTDGRLVLVDGNNTSNKTGSSKSGYNNRQPSVAELDETYPNTTGTSYSQKTASSDGSVTVTNKPYSVAGSSTVSDDVQGARRADTSDRAENIYRCLVIAFCLACMSLFLRNKPRFK